MTCIKLFIYLSIFTAAILAESLKNCPMPVIRPIIQKAVESVGNEATLQMQLIRRILEDIYGGTWGVLIISDDSLIATAVHWTFPQHKHTDGTAAFCLYAENGWQYNVFKTGDVDTENRLSVEDVIRKLREKKNPGERPQQRRRVSEIPRRTESGPASNAEAQTEGDATWTFFDGRRRPSGGSAVSWLRVKEDD